MSSINEIDQELLMELSEFVVETLLDRKPDLNIENLQESRDLKLIQTSEDIYLYNYKGTLPLMVIDTKMLIDGA